MARIARLVVVLGFGLALGCSPPEPEDVRDADGDADVDVDVDADIDADADLDFGGDEPDDVWPPGRDGLEGPRYGDESLCANGEDDDGDGLVDCADPGCRTALVCCAEVSGSWVEGEFFGCDTLSSCGWTPFSVAAGSVELVVGGAVELGGDGIGEVGLWSRPVAGLSGAPTISFVASFAPGTCSEEGCDQTLGLGLVDAQGASLGVGLRPHVALVLDGVARAVVLYVGGRVAGHAEVAVETLTTPTGYAFRVEPDGSVSYWFGVDEVLAGGAALLEGLEPARSATALDLDAGALRVAAFGRLSGRPAARIEGVRLDRLRCEVPEEWARVARGLLPVRGNPGSRVGRPAVVQTLDGGYLMVHEVAGRLAVATSDDGETWESGGLILEGLPPTDYGLVAQRAPALVHWAPPAEEPEYLLWFEGVGEMGTSLPGVSPTAILWATSPDGVEWTEPAEGSIALEGSTPETVAQVPAWRAEVRQPAVAVRRSGSLVMWFVGRNPVTGATVLGAQTSTDGKAWSLWDEPVAILADGGDVYERDGVANPSVAVRQGVFHLWYEGIRGSRAAIVHAVGSSERAFERLGVVFEAEEPWEQGRVGAPAVLVDRPEGTETVLLRMWYRTGPLGAEGLGLAERESPTIRPSSMD